MKLLFFLKTLAEFALFFSFGNYIAVTGGGSSIPFFVAILPVVSLFICFLLQDKKRLIRLCPLALLALGFFFTHGLSSIVVYAVACIYCILLVARRIFYQSYDMAATNFKRCAICLFILPVMTLVVGGMSVLSNNCVPYVLIFLCASVLQTRMLRHDARTLESRGFQLQNMIAIALVLLLGVLMTTPLVLGWLNAAFAFLKVNVLFPLTNVLLYVAIGIVWVISKVLSFIFPNFNPTFPPAEDIVADYGAPTDELIYEGVTQVPMALQVVFTAIGIGILIVAAVFIFKKLTERREQNSGRADFYDKREQLETRDGPPARNLFVPRDARANVRRYYAKFLVECRSRGVNFSKSNTASDIAENAKDTIGEAAVMQITSLYTKARYSPHPITKDDAKAAKEIYYKIKTKKTEENNE